MHNFIEAPIWGYPEKLANLKPPTLKPILILEHIIKIVSNKNDVILDPFTEVDSTGVTCKNFLGNL